MPAVTVVVCAYAERRWHDLSRAVAAVLAQGTAPALIVLVIDHNPSLLDRATRAFPGVTVLPNAGPRGLSGARNTGLAAAKGEIVAFVDDDAEAEPDWLAGLVPHYRDPAVLAVGGSAVPAWDGHRPRWLPPEFDWVVGCSFAGQPVRATPVRNLIGCNMSFRRAALDGVGGFDPALGRVGTVPVGCEETELCIRLRRRHPDGVILYEPSARVRHRVTADRATWRYFRRRCFSEGRSKAVVARLAGAQAGLSAERDYTRRTLPRAVRREARATSADAAALLRAGAIVAGLAVTAGGYFAARVRGATDAAAAATPAGPGPVRVLAVELSDGVPALSDADCTDGRRYRAARVLVRRNGRPLGLVDIDLPPGGLGAEALADLIARRLGPAYARPCAPPPLPAPGRVPFVSVVVPTCGRADVLARTLDTLRAQDYPRYEVVVVDNAPQRPGTAEVVRAAAAAGLPVRQVPEPRRGVSYARNRGLAEARGEIVAYADDDVLVDRGWLRALADGFADEAVAAVTGHILPAQMETPAQVLIEQYGGFGKGCARHRFDRTGFDVLDDDAGVRRVPAGPGSLYPYLPGSYGSGANMAFRTDVLRELGGFDPALGSGGAVRAGEDIDALLRVVLAGHALVYEPSAIVWHTHKRELRALRRTVYDYGVGLGAVIAKRVVIDRRGRRELLRRFPRGIAYAVRPASAKNAHRQPGYPPSLTLLELCGMAAGPVRYAWSAWTTRTRGSRR